MAQADLGKVRLTDAELSEKIVQVNGGVRFGKDADGKPGYVVTDAETGADTVIPFKSGEGGSGGLLSGTICLAGSQIYSGAGTKTIYFSNLFEPIELSKISKVKMLTNIKNWMRVGSSGTSGLQRRIYSLLYLIKKDGLFTYYTPLVIINNSNTATISVENQENIIDLEQYKETCESLFGIGIYLYQYPGGAATSYWFESRIGNVYSPYDSCVKYEVE